MRKIYTAAALLAAALLGVGPASATGTNYKVQVGQLPLSAGNQQLTAASTTSIVFQSESWTHTCSSANVPSQASNVVTNSPTTNVLTLASLARVNFVNCTGPGGALTHTQNGVWELHGVSGATNAANDLIIGHLDNVDLTISNLACRFTLVGRVGVRYNEATKALAVSEPPSSGALKVASGAVCGSNVRPGVAFGLNATFQVSVAGNNSINVKP